VTERLGLSDFEDSCVLSGRGLHSGRETELRIARRDGKVAFRTAHGDATLDELAITRADYGVQLRCDRIGFDADSAEHLLAALAGLSIRGGLVFTVLGGELPLLDGGALDFARCLGGFSVPPSPPELFVAHRGTVEIGKSNYAFEPFDGVALDVEVDFAETGIGVQHAAWDGTAHAFLEEVAWARTFGFRRDAAALAALGRARGVDPERVMVLSDEGRVEAPGAPARPGEFARHKLLDLAGDLCLFGGPPKGKVCATRPGHAATHEAVAVAIRRGLLVRDVDGGGSSQGG
jgi:UDP-3-O-[3-hydroxymyristoyl] N-acetylglucosamine deacetylase